MRSFADVVPDLVIEVRSYFDRWTAIHVKVAEYLKAGVATVVVLDERTQRAWMYREDDDPVEFARDQRLAFPAPLDGWNVMVHQFFES